jgi:hypothetical protein
VAENVGDGSDSLGVSAVGSSGEKNAPVSDASFHQTKGLRK